MAPSKDFIASFAAKSQKFSQQISTDIRKDFTPLSFMKIFRTFEIPFIFTDLEVRDKEKSLKNSHKKPREKSSMILDDGVAMAEDDTPERRPRPGV